MDMVIKEHPEILPTHETPEQIQMMGTSKIVDMMEASKKKMNKMNKMMNDMEADAIKRNKEKFSKSRYREE